MMPTEPRRVSYHQLVANAYRSCLIDHLRVYFQSKGHDRGESVRMATAEADAVHKSAAEEWRKVYRPNRLRS